MSKAISDEELVAAILNSRTLKAAAESVGLSERAVFDRMSNGTFRAIYLSAKADVVRGAVTKLNANTSAAIDTIVEIMMSKENNAAVRLQASQSLLSYACKFSERLRECEGRVEVQKESNRFSMNF